MSGRYLTPSPGKTIAILAAGALLATWQATLASTDLQSARDDAASSSLEIPTDQLLVANIGHEFDATTIVVEQAEESKDDIGATKILGPSAEAALRQVFDDSADASADEPDEQESAIDRGDQPLIKARVPGVSEDDLARYKRQMYRRDI
ncbi:MAG: hypothetical protein WBM76_05030 [Woeseiaceae bacterium]